MRIGGKSPPAGVVPDMEGDVKRAGEGGGGEVKEAATVVTLICAGRQCRCRMTVIRRRAASH